MVRHPTFKLVRPDDLLVIDVTTEGLEPKPTTGGRGATRYELHTQGDAGLLRLRLPPQQLLEYADDESGDATDAGRPIFTDPSEVVFMVTSNDSPILTSAEGILDAARRLPRLIAEDEPSTDSNTPAPNPQQLGTRFDLPYVMRLRLPKRSLRLVQDAEVAEHDGRVALWSSEVAVGPDDTDEERTLKVWFDVLSKAADTPTTITTRVVSTETFDRSAVDIAGAPS